MKFNTDDWNYDTEDQYKKSERMAQPADPANCGYRSDARTNYHLAVANGQECYCPEKFNKRQFKGDKINLRWSRPLTENALKKVLSAVTKDNELEFELSKSEYDKDKMYHPSSGADWICCYTQDDTLDVQPLGLFCIPSNAYKRLPGCVWVGCVESAKSSRGMGIGAELMRHLCMTYGQDYDIALAAIDDEVQTFYTKLHFSVYNSYEEYFEKNGYRLPWNANTMEKAKAKGYDCNPWFGKNRGFLAMPRGSFAILYEKKESKLFESILQQGRDYFNAGEKRIKRVLGTNPIYDRNR